MAELNGKRVILAIQRLGDAKLQEKVITANGEVRPDSGYDGFSKVTVNVPTSGGEITQVATEREMELILANATSFSDGQIFLYTGATTSKYEKDTYYVLQY